MSLGPFRVTQGKKGKVVEPDKHFPVIMEFIKKEAVERYGFDID